MTDAVREVRELLSAHADAATAESAGRFFKEEVRAYGVKSAQVKKIAKSVFKRLNQLPKQDVWALCEELWRSGFLEESGVACEWAYALRKSYQPPDFAVFERWVDHYVSNWAACDTLCNHSVGDFLLMYPDFIEKLLAWTASEKRWKRRAAAVSLIIPARRGHFLPQIFRIAEALLEDGDDMVRKGYGWMLKAAGEAHPEEVFAFVMSRRENMPRDAFRYSLEKMPPEWRKKAMRK